MQGVKGTSSKVELTCETCGKIFYRFPSQAKNGYGKFCSMDCRNKAFSSKFFGAGNPMFGRHHSVEAKRKDSQSLKERWQDPKFRQSVSQPVKELWQDPEYKEKTLEGMAKRSQNPEWVFNNSQAQKKKWQDPEYILNMSRMGKERWRNPGFVAKMMVAFDKKPTKPEKRLIEICSKHFPQYEYNGDFSLGITLGGSIPDFVNTNGRKEVIEVFGDYWHSTEVLGDRWQRSELGKMMIYNSLGYRCLVLWEHDLKEKSEAEIVDMIGAFSQRRK